MSKNLVIVGAGTLGCRVAHLWKLQYPDADVYLKTRTAKEERDAKWMALGFNPIHGEDATKAPFVVFSAPPSGNIAIATAVFAIFIYGINVRFFFADDYVEQMKKAIANHLDKSSNSCFIFTSSGGVYSENAGGVVDETSAVKSDHPYSRRILDAEEQVISVGGCVLRFGGLYTLARGAHNYWLNTGNPPFSSSPDGLINLIHYDDAADAVIAAMQKPEASGETFLVSDGFPISRKNITQAGIKNPKFAEKSEPQFTGEPTVDGKKYDNGKVKEKLNWKPNHENFDTFMEKTYTAERDVPLLD